MKYLLKQQRCVQCFSACPLSRPPTKSVGAVGDPGGAQGSRSMGEGCPDHQHTRMHAVTTAGHTKTRLSLMTAVVRWPLATSHPGLTALAGGWDPARTCELYQYRMEPGFKLGSPFRAWVPPALPGLWSCRECGSPALRGPPLFSFWWLCPVWNLNYSLLHLVLTEADNCVLKTFRLVTLPVKFPSVPFLLWLPPALVCEEEGPPCFWRAPPTSRDTGPPLISPHSRKWDLCLTSGCFLLHVFGFLPCKSFVVFFKKIFIPLPICAS